IREVSAAHKKSGLKVRHLAFRSILRPFFGQKRRKFPDHPAANLQITSAASRFWSHVFSNQCSIPNIRVDFPCFGSKIVEHSRYLPKYYRQSRAGRPVSIQKSQSSFSYSRVVIRSYFQPGGTGTACVVRYCQAGEPLTFVNW